MTVLAAIKKAVLRADGSVIEEVYSSTDQVAVEMADLANEVAKDIVSAQDWRALVKVHEIVPNGGQSFPLPADFDRMTAGAYVHDARSLFWGYEPFGSVDDWVAYLNGDYGLAFKGGWIILNGAIQFYPAPSIKASFPYVSTHFARSEGGVPKGAFTDDDDAFVLDERLLTLGLIWRWKAQKGLEYGEDMATYNDALEKAQHRDRGTFTLRTPRGIHIPGNLAYTGRAIG